MEQHVFSVTEVNQYIKSIIDGVPQLGDLLIRGELSNYKVYPSGHHYFTLKDGESAIRCVMFRSSAGRLRVHPCRSLPEDVSASIPATARISCTARRCRRTVSAICTWPSSS